MLPAHFALCLLACISYSGVTDAIYEDCKNPPPIEHGRAMLFESQEINTAIYSCQAGYELQGSSELFCNVETEEWQGLPPSCVKAKGSRRQPKLKSWMKSVPEDPNVPAELVPTLDESCVHVPAPEISYATVRYERIRRDRTVFRAAYYSCQAPYKLYDERDHALYCSGGQWVGNRPICLDDEDEEYDMVDSDDYVYDSESEAKSVGGVDALAPLPPPPPVEKQNQDEEGEEEGEVHSEEKSAEPEVQPHLSHDQEEPNFVVPVAHFVPAADPNQEVQVIEQVSEANAEHGREIDPKEQLEPEVESTQDVKSEWESEPEPEVQQMPVLEPKTEKHSGPELAEPVPEPEAEPELIPEAEADPQPEPESVAAPQPEPQPEPEPKAEAEPAPIEPAPVTDINIVVEPTKDPYTPRLLDDNCGEDRGGCAHMCERLLFPGENEPRLKCSCRKGYTLDPEDYASCHDIDECQESNGGCAQICNNLPGGHECSCGNGYRIGIEYGKCVDIDECAEGLAEDCNEGCENTPGSYRCVTALNAKEEVEEEEPQETDQDNEIELDKEEQTPVEPEVPKTKCNPGFALSPDGRECKDINECDIVVDSDDADHVPHRVCQHLCENTIGSYRCGCREGFHLLEDKSSCVPDTCQDLDNPLLSRLRCAHECQDQEAGGYVCLCPDGYKLAADLHSCEVLETVCSREQGHERCRPGSCLPSEDNSTFSCLCPPGYASDVYSCQDLDECVLGTHKCSHDCFNTAGGYQCLCPRGMTLQEPDGHTCVAPDPCAFNNNGCEQLCLSADGGACTCSKGYTLSADGKSCSDVDECEVNNGGCQQACRNQPGGYECVCDDGFEPLHTDGLSGFCFDIDECTTNRHGCGPSMRCENLNGSYTCLCEQGYALGFSSPSPSTSSSSSSPLAFALPACLDIDECSISNANCSHFCINLPGSFECACPLGFSLAADAHSCQDDDECQLDNGRCSQLCLNQPGGFACACLAGYELAPDGFGCLDIDECAQDFGNCSSICVNLLGGHVCACERGYELASDGKTCQDVDECAGLLSGGCTHECINKPGSYECGCPLGYLLQDDGRSCRPALIGCPPGSRQSEQGCEPIECAVGELLGSDGNCVDIDECQVNNGGCSHDCVNTQSSFKCACPAGFQLAANERDCSDVDECAVNNGGCEESCINEPGSFKCDCPAGKLLSFDQRSCYSVPTPEPKPALRPLPPIEPVERIPMRPFPTLPPFDSPATFTPAVRRPSPPRLPSLPNLPSVPSVSRVPSVPSAGRRSNVPSVSNVPRMPSLPSSPGYQVKDQCVPFQAPSNGLAQCNKYRHRQKLFYTTRCKVSCSAGYRLVGSDVRTCGASGQWEGAPNKCVRISQANGCAALPTPSNGVITPASCTQGVSGFGSICRLQCNLGFVPVGGLLTTCFNGWTLANVLECKPFVSNFFDTQIRTRIQAPWQLNQTPFRTQSTMQVQPVQTIERFKAYMTCPENVVIQLQPGQSRAHVILQRPDTNVDLRHVVASPNWARRLQAHLPPGVHKVVYRAHDPVTAQSVGCQTTIVIRQALAAPSSLLSPPFAHYRPVAMPTLPEFRPVSYSSLPMTHRSESLVAAPVAEVNPAPTPAPRAAPVPVAAPRMPESNRIDLGSSSSQFCPPSFEVQLKENQNLRSVVWEEPRFEGKLLKIYKSSFPGALFKQGRHEIKYEATTTDGRNQYCIFHIDVKAAAPAEAAPSASLSYSDLSAAPAALTQSTGRSLFAGHESYVVCPDKEPVKVTSSQSVNLPVGCTLKNVRPQTSRKTQPRRGLLTSLWRQYNNF